MDKTPSYNPQSLEIPKLSYVEGFGIGKFLATIGSAAGTPLNPSVLGVEVISHWSFNLMLAPLQNMETMSEYHQELHEVARFDHPDVDDLLFRVATTARTVTTALFAAELLGVRMFATMRCGGACHGHCQAYLIRLANRDCSLYRDVTVWAAASLVDFFSNLLAKAESDPLATET